MHKIIKTWKRRFLHGLASDDACLQQFIIEMNKKSIQLSMTNTVFLNPHGLIADGQVSTSRDMLLLALQAAGTENLLKVWGAKNYTVSIEGPHARELKLRSLVASPLIEEEYTFLGGKTGTVNAKKTNVLLLLADKASNLFLTTVMGATSNENRFIDARKLVKIAQKRLSNPSYQPDEKLSAVSGSVLAINGHPLFWANALPPSLYEINENEQLAPVSLNKVMTALLLLEHVANLHETFTFKESDITRGSGPQMYAGDTISFLDALYLMMLPSSNSTATAVGRVVGRRMIAVRGIH